MFLGAGVVPIVSVAGTYWVNIRRMTEYNHSSLCQLILIEVPCDYFNRFFHSKMSYYLRVLSSLRDLCLELVVGRYVKTVRER